MPSRRLLRVADLLREEIDEILRRSVHDPRVQEHDFTVTRVEASPDLRHARVFVSTLLDEAGRAALIEGMNRAAGFVHRELMGRVRLKAIPAVEFVYDPGLAQSQRIADLLTTLKSERPRP